MKVLLILVDGMRPDAMKDISEAKAMMDRSAFTLCARTVMPSVTLPCHMSLFHSVEPQRHGITTNTYVPQVRPVKGLCEVLSAAGRRCAFFYNWEQLRDLSRPNSLAFSYFCQGADFGYEESNNMVVKAAAEFLKEHPMEFAFVYLGNVDAVGHKYGWMGAEYMDAVAKSWKNIADLTAALPEYTTIVTADHGGHERSHGCDTPEDMTIPLLIQGEGFAPGTQLGSASIMDIAPTITKLLGVPADREWEGKSLI